ncbi:MAG: hypothetical protein C0184_12385 [Chloroflexus aggregans]|uniref:Aminoglycoside phosphotransferase domain-containing protein n=1 Tax=Chloroflexus aggregans TaxID=152260 RepID=A0A2J6WZW4_9CHLR|nr:MAG: hypothetical protein C0184_12385 [Chloroflexus aggregans]
MTEQHHNDVFAPIDIDHVMERVAGGNETEVYCSDDRRFVVKLKGELASRDAAAMLADARRMQQAAQRFAACLGSRHTIPTYFLLSRDSEGFVHALAIQPYLVNARVLAGIDWQSVDTVRRRQIGRDLRHMIARAVGCLFRTGHLPDLYGRVSANAAERSRRKQWCYLPERLWSFLVERTILQSQNLMLTDEQPPRLILIDYDEVRRNRLYRLIYFLARLVLFGRDLFVIWWKLER